MQTHDLQWHVNEGQATWYNVQVHGTWILAVTNSSLSHAHRTFPVLWLNE